MTRLTSLMRLKMPPISMLDLKEVKLFLKIDHDLEDALLETFIGGVCERFENYCGLSLSPQSYRAQYSNFSHHELELPKKPIVKIEEINVTNINGSHHKLNKAHYYLSNDTIHFRATPYTCSLSVDFVCGYKSLPYDIRLLLIEHVANIYEHRLDKFDIKRYDEFRDIKI